MIEEWMQFYLEYRMVYSIPFFLIGTSIASFYCNLAYRISIYFYSQERKKFKGLPRWKKILLHPSSCENCSNPIRSFHLIPVIGFFISKGECPSCGYKIPLIYPIAELFFGIVSIFILWIHANPLVVLFFLLLMGQLLISMVTDLRYFSLDYENLLWIFLWGFGLNILINGSPPSLSDYLVFIGFFGFFLILHLFYPRGMGMGDVLFAPVFAFLSGHPWWLFFLNAAYIPAVVITILMRKKGESLKEVPIPMGLYFCIGLFLTFFVRLIFERYGMELNYD